MFCNSIDVKDNYNFVFIFKLNYYKGSSNVRRKRGVKKTGEHQEKQPPRENIFQIGVQKVLMLLKRQLEHWLGFSQTEVHYLMVKATLGKVKKHSKLLRKSENWGEGSTSCFMST